MQALWAGHELIAKGMQLDNKTCINFLQEVRDQTSSSLRELGHNPVKINLGTISIPTIKTRINGEEV